jgi:hypothetical protein
MVHEVDAIGDVIPFTYKLHIYEAGHHSGAALSHTQLPGVFGAVLGP